MIQSVKRQLIKISSLLVIAVALLVTAGCKIPITVTSNPPGAKAYVGPMNGNVFLVDSTENPVREQYAGNTPVTVQSFYAWNEGGHAWAHVEWPDGTKSTVKFRKPRPFGLSPAEFDFNESDYTNISPPKPTPAWQLPPAPKPAAVKPTPIATAQPAATASAPATTASSSAIPSSAFTASSLIGTWKNDDDTNEWLVIQPNFSATWHISAVENNGFVNLISDNQIRFDYHDRAFNKNDSLNWKIVDGQTMTINRYGRDEVFRRQ